MAIPEGYRITSIWVLSRGGKKWDVIHENGKRRQGRVIEVEMWRRGTTYGATNDQRLLLAVANGATNEDERGPEYWERKAWTWGRVLGNSLRKERAAGACRGGRRRNGRSSVREEQAAT